MKPPVNPVSISYRLARGIVHNLTQADPESHQRPEFNVPTQDARWFRLCTVDGVTVTTADGCGVVYRQRDRRKMFSLLLKSLRRQRQLASRLRRDAQGVPGRVARAVQQAEVGDGVAASSRATSLKHA